MMGNKYNIVMIINARGFDTSCVGNVHRLPMIQALASGLEGRGNLLIVTAPERKLKINSEPRIEKMGTNYFLFTPSMPLPISLAERFLPLLKLYRYFLRRQLFHVLDKLEISQDDPKVLWITHSFHYHYLGLIDEKLRIYECYDDFMVFGRRRPNRHVRHIENNLARSVDIILTTAQSLQNRLSKINPETHYFPNAADFKLFNSVLKEDIPLANEMNKIGRPVIGFTGNILHHCVDFDLLYEFAAANPNWSFVFVGQTEGGDRREYSRLTNLPNTHFLGWKDYYMLPSYLKGFDVAIMPYKVNQTMKSVNPNKLYQFMAAGIPVISTPIPEAKHFEGIVEIASDKQGFEKATHRFLGSVDSGLRDKMISVAQKNSWEKRVETALGLIEKRWKKN